MSRKAIGWAAVAAFVLIAAGLFVFWVESKSDQILTARHPFPGQPLRVAVSQSTAQEGLRQARLNGCFSCHRADLAGGPVSHGVFGFHLTASNLTRATKTMTDAQIATAIRYGIAPNGQALFEMPASDYIRLSDSDTAAIIAYLHTLQPRPDAASPTHWDFEGRMLLATGLLNNEADAVDRTQRGPAMTPKAQLALGRYLTQTQCTGCHGADLGGDAEMQSPDLSSEAHHYTLAEFQHFFATGEPRKRHDTVIMSHAINVALKYLTPQEVAAIYVYLRGPQKGGKQ